MAEKTTSQTSKDQESVRLPFLKTTRNILLAAVGAAALAQDEIEDFVARLIERGEIAEKDGRDLVHEIIHRRRKARQKFIKESGARFRKVFDIAEYPTKKDIESLEAKINALNKKLDEISPN